jgi:hypothetical protein
MWTVVSAKRFDENQTLGAGQYSAQYFNGSNFDTTGPPVNRTIN